MDVAVRVWWDQTEEPVMVQAAKGGQWVSLIDQADPGFETPVLPRGTALRVGNTESGFSEPLYVPWFFGPAELSALGAEPGTLLAGTVGEVVVDGKSIWAATLGGGLVRVEDDEVRIWTRYDGLPSDTVIAVAAAGPVVLAGTASGAVRLNEGVVERVWDTELPHPWTQAVALDGEHQWAGTLHGLVRLAPWSVFSDKPPSVYTLAPDGQGRVWAGMGGLRNFESNGTLGPVVALENDRIYDIVIDDEVWVASEDGGVHRSQEGSMVPQVDLGLGSAFSLAKLTGGWWAAGGSQGLFGPAGQVVGYPDGLPGHSVWALASATDGASLWVGTDRGLAQFTPAPPTMLPIVRRFDVGVWPARSPTAAVLPAKHGFWVVDDRGVRRFGLPHRYAQNLEVAGPEQMRTLLSDAKTVWAVGRWQIVRMDRRGRLRSGHTRVGIRDATLFRGNLWFISEQGLHKWDARNMTASLVLERPGFTRLVAGSRSMWGVMDGIPVQVIGGMSRPFLRASAVEDLSVAGDFVCLGTRDGLEMMFPDGEVVDVLGESDAREVISAVAADGAGACWFASATGKVGRTGTADQVRLREIPIETDAEVYRIVPDGDWAWILTNQGTWRVHIEKP